MDSPIGVLTIAASDKALTNLSFGRDEMLLASCEVTSPSEHQVLRRTAAELAEYFSGVRTTFTVPVALDGTEFQCMAWRALAQARFGTTMTYAEQAASIGRPTATRAVGAANGRNPVAIVLPCHRVVGKDGSLTGFAGGLDVKKWLLAHERAVTMGTTAGAVHEE